MRKLAFLIGLSVFILDLLTKWWVKNTFSLHNYRVIDGFFTLQYVRNEGIAFGLLHSLDSEWKTSFLALIAVVAMAIVSYYVLTTPPGERLLFLAFGLLLGGISGNFVDRVMHGYVFDFLTLHWKDHFSWPTFNVADAAISTGVFIILAKTFLSPSAEKASQAMLFVFLAGLSSLQQLNAETLVSRIQQRYEQVDTMRAHFVQTFENHGIEFRESGILLIKKPGLMYWEYREPDRKVFVADGQKTYFYLPSENQMLVSSLVLEESDSPLLFLLGRGQIERDFDVAISDEVSTGTSESVVLRMTPRRPHPEFSYLLAEVSSETYLIERLVVVEPIGQRNEYYLTNIELNVRIPDQKFRVEVPRHVEVIEQ